MPSDRPPIIAIDGPVGSGKSQVARRLAARLGLLYIDTGAMYRAVTLAALQRGCELDDARALAALSQNIRIELKARPEGLQVLCDGADVTSAIRDPKVSANTSIVADNEDVRAALVAQQQRLGEQGGVVMEGRDIGTVVFPGADLKFYLDATPEVRARRRYDELVAAGVSCTYEGTLAALLERDRRDTTRAVGALRVAEDAIIIDTTRMSLEEVVDKIVSIVSTPR